MRARILAAVAGYSLAAPLALAQVCGHWEPMPIPDLQPGVFGAVNALAVYDDGTGPALYFGGSFQFERAGQPTSRSLAKWVGGALVPVPFPSDVFSMLVVQEGPAPVLFIASSDHVYKLSGQTLAQLPGTFSSPINVLAPGF